MKKKVANKVKKLREAYEEAVAAYLVALGDFWDIDVATYGYWVKDDIIEGGLWFYGDSIVMTVEDIVMCVENEISYDTFIEYTEYNVFCLEFGFEKVNLRSYISGFKRIDQKTIDKLYELKNEMNKLVDEAKTKF